jgi:hypothetical protein
MGGMPMALGKFFWNNAGNNSDEIRSVTGDSVGAYPNIKKLDSLAIYYSWPSSVNGAGGNILQAAKHFSVYDLAVFGESLVEPGHMDHDNTRKIFSLLKGIDGIPKTTVFGYVNLGNRGDQPDRNKLFEKAKSWSEMGADGIFYDCASPDYGVDIFEQLRPSAEAARKYGMKCFYNADKLSWIIDSGVLIHGDSILIEPVVFNDGKPWRLKYTDLTVKEITKGNPELKLYGVAKHESIAYVDEKKMDLWKKQYQNAKEWSERVGLAGLCFTDSSYSVGIMETILMQFGERIFK